MAPKALQFPSYGGVPDVPTAPQVLGEPRVRPLVPVHPQEPGGSRAPGTPVRALAVGRRRRPVEDGRLALSAWPLMAARLYVRHSRRSGQPRPTVAPAMPSD